MHIDAVRYFFIVALGMGAGRDIGQPGPIPRLFKIGSGFW